MAAVADEFQLDSRLWTPQRRGLEETISLLKSGRDVCYYGCTGSGKTRVSGELIRWASYHGIPSCFYVNRKLLVSQTYERFVELGLDVGIRAAEYEDYFNGVAMVQICSADTERIRVHKTKQWDYHDAGLVIIDELHINRSGTIEQIIRDYKRMGAHIVGLTATPLGVSHLVDELVVSGTMQDYRDCKAIVPAYVYSITQPDLSKIQRNKTGEFILDGQKKKIFTQSIIGDVYSVAWRKHNPDGRPTFLFAPGCAESAFTAKYFNDRGARWAHIDASEVWLDGKRYSRKRSVWHDLLEMFKDGSVKGISSRFVLREGVDVPCAYQEILATPIGSLASYIQVAGRVLRYSQETPEKVIISDLGGNYWRHGSPNETRPWKDWFGLDESEVSRNNERVRKETGEGDPIRCPECGLERKSGRACPACGFEHPRGMRYIKMLDGEVKLVEGAVTKKVRTQRRSDTEKKWTDLFWAWRQSKNTTKKSMAQLEAYFLHEFGYRPPRDLPFMPKNPRDWFQRVADVDFSLLNPGR